MIQQPTTTITWLGHATALIELDGVSLLTDPVLRNRIGPLVRIADRDPPSVIGRVDAVLLSHLHADHAEIASLRMLARSAPVLAPYPASRWLTRHGVRRVHELRAGEQLRVAGLRVTAVRASHDSRRRPFGPAAEPIGYLLSGSRSVYFAGDTDLFPEMAELRGAVTAALLPVWGWGARLGPGHLDPCRAAAAAGLIAPRCAIPIHWGTFALGRPARRPSDPERPVREFVRLAALLAPDVDVRVLATGQRTEL